jgi:hypothetical protein
MNLFYNNLNYLISYLLKSNYRIKDISFLINNFMPDAPILFYSFYRKYLLRSNIRGILKLLFNKFKKGN